MWWKGLEILVLQWSSLKKAWVSVVCLIMYRKLLPSLARFDVTGLKGVFCWSYIYHKWLWAIGILIWSVEMIHSFRPMCCVRWINTISIRIAQVSQDVFRDPVFILAISIAMALFLTWMFDLKFFRNINGSYCVSVCAGALPFQKQHGCYSYRRGGSVNGCCFEQV